MKTMRKWMRPPESDEEYVESVRKSLRGEKTGVYDFLASIVCLGLVSAVWYFFKREPAIQVESPELYYCRAAGWYLGVVGGALGAFWLYSLDENGTAQAPQRGLLDLCLILAVLVIALLLVFWVPSLVTRQKKPLERATSTEGNIAGLLLGFLLCAAFHKAFCARQRFFGWRRAEQLMVKCHDDLKMTKGPSCSEICG